MMSAVTSAAIVTSAPDLTPQVAATDVLEPSSPTVNEAVVESSEEERAAAKVTSPVSNSQANNVSMLHICLIEVNNRYLRFFA